MNFSTIHDQIFVAVKEALPEHKELDDNVVIENNNSLKLNKGFCIEFRGARNTNRVVDCLMSVAQDIVITNTLSNRGTETDIEARKRAEKAILEDCYKIVKAIESNVQLDDTCEKIEFSSHNGIELIISDDEKTFLMVQATYSIEWFKTKEF